MWKKCNDKDDNILKQNVINYVINNAYFLQEGRTVGLFDGTDVGITLGANVGVLVGAFVGVTQKCKNCIRPYPGSLS